MSSSLREENRSNSDGGLAEAAVDSMNSRDRGRILFVVRTSEKFPGLKIDMISFIALE